MSADKYPDMSAVYSVMFTAEDRLKEEIEKLKKELDRTRKALDVANAVIMDYAKEKLEKKEEK